MSELSKAKEKEIRDELAKKKRIREANRAYVSKLLHVTETIFGNPEPSSMETIQPNVGLLREKADATKNHDSDILELFCESGSGESEKEIKEKSEFARRIMAGLSNTGSPNN